MIKMLPNTEQKTKLMDRPTNQAEQEQIAWHHLCFHGGTIKFCGKLNIACQ